MPDYRRGDRVLVSGYGGRTGILRVWETNWHGVWLCSEEGYRRLQQECVAPIVGFPSEDIVGLADESPA